MAVATIQDLGFQRIGSKRNCKGFAHNCAQYFCRRLQKAAAVITFASLLFTTATAQEALTNAATNPTQPPVPTDLQKYPGLLPELGQLLTKLQRDVQFPPARNQSRLLNLLPESTVFFAAIPNYGEASHQVVTTFRSELEQSSVLREWWQHGDMATTGPKIEDSIDKVSQLYQYLGDEIVVAGALPKGGNDKDPQFLILAEVKKPGLKDFLERTAKELATASKPPVRIVDLPELTAAKDSSGQLLVLVRPDFVVAAPNAATLREFNAQLDKGPAGFPATPFGQRIVEAYQGGTSFLAAADFQQIIGQIPIGPNQKTFERTGFADAKYAVWSHTSAPGQSASQSELSFTGPRHGIASWLAAPGPMGSLDFVSSKAVMAGAVLLKDPAMIFDDISDLAIASNPKALMGFEQMQQGLRVNLKADLLSHLTGEIAYEIENMTPPNPAWKVILRVDDPFRVQTTFAKLLAMAPVQASISEENGVAYHILQIPSAQKTTEIAYAFLDGYLIVASSRDILAEGIRFHRSGESLAKSAKFLAALPSGNTSQASAVFYQVPGAMATMSMRQLSPEFASFFSQMRSSDTTPPAAMCLYGEEDKIREASRSSGFDVTGALIGAAVAIPNLLRARMAANESSAVASIRTLNTAQIMYSNAYPQRGYAPDLARLGPDSQAVTKMSADHAHLVDATLANETCTTGAWCEKSGYKFTVTSGCRTKPCKEYAVIGTPVSTNTGTRTFCSTSDGVIRYKSGTPMSEPVTAAECKSWSALQ